MAVDANFKFLARQLALSDFPEGEVVEVDGGCLITTVESWIASWDPEAITDTDGLAEELLASDSAKDLGKWLVIAPIDSADEPPQLKLAESLFLCGLVKADFKENGDPDNIQVMNKPAFPEPPAGLDISTVEAGDENLFNLITSSESAPENLGYQLSGITQSPVDTLSYAIAMAKGQPVGAVAWRTCGAICRIVWVWVSDDQRGKGVGSALTRFTVETAAGSGAVVSTVWTGLKGSLRYFFSKLGFEDQLRVSSYLPE